MRYALAFLFAALVLTAGAVTTFRQLSSASVTASQLVNLQADTLERPAVITPLYPSAADYAHYEAEDSVWRARNARRLTLAELRARGDGRRTPREQMEDRVFRLTRSGKGASAVDVLRQWVDAHPRDADALLSLARLLNELGRGDESIERYRQILALRGGGDS